MLAYLILKFEITTKLKGKRPISNLWPYETSLPCHMSKTTMQPKIYNKKEKYLILFKFLKYIFGFKETKSKNRIVGIIQRIP